MWWPDVTDLRTTAHSLDFFAAKFLHKIPKLENASSRLIAKCLSTHVGGWTFPICGSRSISAQVTVFK